MENKLFTCNIDQLHLDDQVLSMIKIKNKKNMERGSRRKEQKEAKTFNVIQM